MQGRSLSTPRINSLRASAERQGTSLLKFDQQILRASYNRKPFEITHGLSDHPMFTLDRLFQLCRRLTKENVFCRPGQIPLDSEFDVSLTRSSAALSLDDAIENLKERRAYIVIFNPEVDPEYTPIIEGLIGEISAQTQAIDPDINWYASYVFISANESVTPYHMDREMNFLLQIRGLKTVMLWDPTDEDVMSEADKDQLLSYRDSRRPTWKDSLAGKAAVYELRPRTGVHHPFIAPHVVRTTSDISVSLALTFRTRNSDALTNTHAFNYQLRRFGIVPNPVRRNPRIDRLKSDIIRGLRNAHHFLKERT